MGRLNEKQHPAFKAMPDLEAQLAQFTGTENYYIHQMSKLRYTDGVAFLAEKAGAYWLLDLIGSWQPEIIARYGDRGKEFQAWRLVKKQDSSGWIARCEDGNNGYLVSQEIEYSDFPLDIVEVWCIGGVMLLPSEY
jgi:hypothetical protein